jgi:DNA-binding transcriptional MerR regulator
MPLSRVPNYNLKAVIQETGVSADSLRAWERRYGLPMPKRTPGGHRLYSERDIRIIRWLRTQLNEGMSISRAVNLWNELLTAGTDPLREAAPQPASSPAPVLTELASLRGNWLQACLEYNESLAEQWLNEALAMFSNQIVVSELIQRGMHEIGEMWQKGQASVQQEHFMSSLSMRRLDALIEAAPPPVRSEAIMLACPEGELHTLPLRFLHLQLRRDGWRVVFLGADVPSAHLEATVQGIKPSLVVMAAQQLVTAATLKQAAKLLRSLRVPLGFGGRVFNVVPEVQGAIPGVFLGGALDAAAERIREVLQMPSSPPPRVRTREAPEAELFREAQPQIEASIYKRFAREALPSRHLGTANHFLGAALEAALTLGNARYVEADIDWVKPLLRAQGFPDGSLRQYLLAYAHAVRHKLGGDAEAIVEWLETYATSL